MMVAQPSLQRGDKLLMGACEPGMTQPGQYPWITFARHNRSQNPPTAEAENIRDYRGQLDVGFLQCRLNTLGVTNDLTRQLTPRAGQVAQFLDRLRRHERSWISPWARRSAIQVASLASLFPPRYVSNVRGVGQD